uniref:CARD domain-containing protein n=1 Tax=Plectus sambesii TaxID=2011161 RepID=A0A914VKS7_9BILA
MEPANAAKIDSHFDYIVQNMDTYSTLKNLLENRTLSSENHQRIGRITLSVDANQELLKVLKETPGAYEKFIDALNESKQFQLVQTLQTMSAPAPLSSPEAEEGQSPTEDPITTPLPSHEKKGILFMKELDISFK